MKKNIFANEGRQTYNEISRRYDAIDRVHLTDGDIVASWSMFG